MIEIKNKLMSSLKVRSLEIGISCLNDEERKEHFNNMLNNLTNDEYFNLMKSRGITTCYICKYPPEQNDDSYVACQTCNHYICQECIYNDGKLSCDCKMSCAECSTKCSLCDTTLCDKAYCKELPIFPINQHQHQQCKGFICFPEELVPANTLIMRNGSWCEKRLCQEHHAELGQEFTDYNGDDNRTCSNCFLSKVKLYVLQ